MNHQKLLLIAAVTFLIFSCFIAQTAVFASDDQNDNRTDEYIYVPETGDDMIIDDQTDVPEENDMNYEDTEGQNPDEDIYIENDINEPADEMPGYEELEQQEENTSGE